MNNQFDELTEGPAQSVTRRTALKKFGIGLASRATASQTPAIEARGSPIRHAISDLQLSNAKPKTASPA